MRSISLTFDLHISSQQIYDFRGAIIYMIGLQNDLFHNREVLSKTSLGKPLQRYPKIQYRIQNGRATLWGIDEGADALLQITEQQLNDFEMFGVQTPLRIYQRLENHHFIPEIQAQKTYLLKNFISLNNANHEIYESKESYAEKVQMLEQIILNELVLFSYAIHWKLTDTMTVQLKDIVKQSTAKFKTKENQETIFKSSKSFDILFQTNALLPEAISLGRHKAYGYGILTSV